MFFCEYCEIFKNTYFGEHLRTATSITPKNQRFSDVFRGMGKEHWPGMD